MKRCVIVGAGELYGEIALGGDELIIAADGGFRYLRDRGIMPDILVGDFDSIGGIPETDGVEVVRHPIEKDETDMYLAYKIGVSRGCNEFYIYGGVGGREDHTFANYCLLLDAKNDNKQIYLMGNGYKIFVIKNEKAELEGMPGKTVSVFAFGSDAHGVTVKGLKYEAEDITLSCAFPLGVSNSFVEGGIRAEISVEDGALLVMTEI